MPSAHYLTATAAILTAGASDRTAVAALLPFNVVAFALTEIPMVSFLVAPDATRARVDRLYAWSNAHRPARGGSFGRNSGHLVARGGDKQALISSSVATTRPNLYGTVAAIVQLPRIGVGGLVTELAETQLHSRPDQG